jgi:hypothetical protein
VAAASKLVPQWTTLDARALARGKLVPLRVQRLRWSRATTAPVDWRATNFPAARRTLGALGRALARTGLRCTGEACEAGEGAVDLDWCEGTNAVRAPGKAPPSANPPPRRASGGGFTPP